MARIEEFTLRGTTDGSGDLIVNAAHPVIGWLVAVEWIDGALADGVDAVLSSQVNADRAAVTLLTLTDANIDKWYFPREIVHDNAGAVLTGTQGGDTMPAFFSGKLRLVVSNGGDTKEGGCIVYVKVLN